MDLSALQQDALIELINIGFGRAGRGACPS